MKVLFRKAVPQVARAGEIQEVAEAYARNYLLPKGLAVAATAAVVAESERKMAQAAASTAAKTAALAEARKRLEGVTIRLRGTASPAGKLFAAIKSEKIISEIEQQFSVKLDGVECRPSQYKLVGSQDGKLIWPDGGSSSMTIVIEHD